MTNTTLPRRLVRVAAALAIVAAPLALAGCSATPAASPQDSTSAVSLGARWGDCMRDAGFDVEDPSDDQVRSGTVVAPSGVDRGRFDRAAQHCGAELGVKPADTAQQDEWKREYAAVDSCVRERYPDAPEQRPGVVDYSGYPRAQEPEFDETLSACIAEHAPDTRQLDH